MTTRAQNPKTKRSKTKVPAIKEIFSTKPKYKLPQLTASNYSFSKHNVYFLGIVGAIIHDFIFTSINWKKKFDFDGFEGKYWVRKEEIIEYLLFINEHEIEASLDLLLTKSLIKKYFTDQNGELITLYSIV